ncbi:Retaining alpha-galactosidase precursor [Sesbania bispinosa]|nr:Retaining alpha-galactosidase precursor [Sesbania bispinosa]
MLDAPSTMFKPMVCVPPRWEETRLEKPSQPPYCQERRRCSEELKRKRGGDMRKGKMDKEEEEV